MLFSTEGDLEPGFFRGFGFFYYIVNGFVGIGFSNFNDGFLQFSWHVILKELSQFKYLGTILRFICIPFQSISGFDGSL